jgi:hypothetical protein
MIALLGAMIVMPVSATATTLPPSDDCFIDECNPGSPGDTGYSFMRVWGVPDQRNRALIHFDLSSIPSGATIDSTTLRLFLYENIGGTDKTQNIHRVTESWTENGATWNSKNMLMALIQTMDG